jgi:SAM-dependent methyltransferase
MEAIEYERMAAIEDQFWWFQALRRNMLTWLPPPGAAPLRLLDAGAGTGGWLKYLATHRPDIAAIGLEFDGKAAVWGQARCTRPFVRGTINGLPFAPASIDIITSSDVLCHAGVDEAKALAEFHAALKPGGRVLLSLPAYDWLLSEHDRAVHNSRRYTEPRLRQQLTDAGFRPLRSSYWNSLLFPLMVLRRKLWPSEGSDVSALPPLVDAGFSLLTGLETAWLRRGGRLPFGGSILIEAVKDA